MKIHTSALVLLFTNFCQVTFCLKLKFSSDSFLYIPRIKGGIAELFTILRSEKRYDVMYELLDLKTMDLSFGYTESCRSLTSAEYRNIMEHHFRSRQVDRLKLLLSPDCLVSTSPNILLGTINSLSLADLPFSLLETSVPVFNIRHINGKHTFQRIVRKALDLRNTEIIWDNIFINSNLPENALRLQLADGFSNFSHHDLKNEIFYYLTPSLVQHCIGNDLRWVVGIVLPFVPLSIEAVYQQKFLDKALLTAWTSQIFRMISSLAIYFEIDFNSRKSGISSELSLKLQVAKDELYRELTIFFNYVNYLRRHNPQCLTLMTTLNILNDLFILFMFNNEDSRGINVNKMYAFVCGRFRDFAPTSSQSDWMLNLFALFWRRKFTPLRLQSMEDSISLFFFLKPTIKSVQNVFLLYRSVFKYDLQSSETMRRRFELLIPEERLVELYNSNATSLIEIRFESIPFETRYFNWIKRIRKQLVIPLLKYELVALFDELPDPSNIPTKASNEDMLSVLISTTLALQRSNFGITKIHSYCPSKLATKDLIRPVDFVTVLLQFFDILLLIEDFRIIDSYDDFGRPIVIFTPLISNSLANVLGQCLALAAALNVAVPFIIDYRSFQMIFSSASSEDVIEKIRAFCNIPARLNILSTAKDVHSDTESFTISLKRYFQNFYKWANLFFTQSSTFDSFKLIDESILDINSAIDYGFKLYTRNSKFTVDELYRIIFK
jgi:hypothetical protein